ncbi:apolipoprotein N-acyltransferase [Nocardioides marmoribigeumensis]|uniref:Apolipoprotein N-acyltransferase n=1 Tax=Nocardioides marmoribigeumensis TaxID=433649 RepID=A0ABU2C133_9ACTN|nr:apolipoprotein N-acyltransferase [Nocardioides marmoribigeumensis]MDR7364371.1 apolipoprotein N-acyltransferase [Nocardioides marmoribigeumensis]
MRVLWWRCLLAAASGVAAALAFPPYAVWWLLPIATAGLVVATPTADLTRPRRAVASVGLAFGLAFCGVLLSWIRVVGPDVAVGLTILEGVFFVLVVLGLRWVRVLPLWPLWSAAVWVGVDLLRSEVPWGGLPWGSLAFATAGTPWAEAMPRVGTAGTGFLVALTGTTLGWLALEWWPAGGRRRVVSVLAPIGVLAVTVPAVTVPWTTTETKATTVRIAAVQGDVPGEGLEAFAERRAVLDNHVRETHLLADRVSAGSTPRPDLVLWPENSTDIDPFEDGTVFADIQNAVDAVDVPVLVGAMVTGPGPHDVENRGIVWSPASADRPGPGDYYAKRHPVPFGEYIPMRDQLATYFRRLDQIPRDMVPGTRSGALQVGGTTLGDVICFEVAYDDLVHDVVRQGARVLVVQTNNATYMGTGQIEQQFAIARLRALETDRYVAVVATNGVSGLIAPTGEVLRRLPVREPGTWEADVPELTAITPAVRAGDAIAWGLAGVALLTALAGAVVRRRRPAASGRGRAVAPHHPDETERERVGSER